jgi:penicillin-binding protein 1C
MKPLDILNIIIKEFVHRIETWKKMGACRIASDFSHKITSSRKKRIFIILFGFFLVIFLLIPTPSFPPDYSTMVLDRNGEILHVSLNKKEQWCLPPDGEFKIPDKLKKAVLEYEDRWFFRHAGVNPVSIVRAAAQNARAGGVQSGASTITMQAARLSRPKPRTVPNKLFEMLQALKLEALHSKLFIFRLYLDHAPYGRNVVGVGAASYRYFGKPPDRLSWAEAACLAVLPNNPGLIAPGRRTDLLRKKRDALLNRLARRGMLGSETLELSLLEPVPSESRPFFSAARHLARRLEMGDGQAGGIVRTTLDMETQLRAEALVREHVAGRLMPLGIRNAAALAVETVSGKIRAYVGSQDFFDSENNGQVDGVESPRSSGSLLKPFLYALAMDEGILLPQTEIVDVPAYYGAFSPSNASERYDGLVTVKEALVRSLNVPAVRVLYSLGVAPFYAFLRSAGVNTLFRAPDDYGLPLILGGAEVTVWNMAALFRGLGMLGRFAPLQVIENRTEQKPDRDRRGGRSLISPGACWLTLNMLRELKRPEAEYYWELYQSSRPLAWKTGTSYGQRDAWAAGVSPRWTVVVWAGNFTGEGNANVAGGSCAGTLLFALYNALSREKSRDWFEAPAEDLDPVTLCLETGYLAGPYCDPAKTLITDAPRFMKSLKLCPYHRRVFLSSPGDSSMEVCAACWRPNRKVEADMLAYPADVAQFLRESGKTVSDIPPHNPACPAGTSGDVLEILYPRENARLWIPRDLNGELQKVTLRAAHREKESLIYWYLDDRYLGSTQKRHNKACLLSKGRHTLHVVDGDGNAAHIRFTAESGG